MTPVGAQCSTRTGLAAGRSLAGYAATSIGPVGGSSYGRCVACGPLRAKAGEDVLRPSSDDNAEVPVVIEDIAQDDHAVVATLRVGFGVAPATSDLA